MSARLSDLALREDGGLSWGMGGGTGSGAGGLGGSLPSASLPRLVVIKADHVHRTARTTHSLVSRGLYRPHCHILYTRKLEKEMKTESYN